MDEYLHCLQRLNAKSELWWDSSLSLLAGHRQQLAGRYPRLRDYIECLLGVYQEGGNGHLTGSTTNPRLVTGALMQERHRWQTFAYEQGGGQPCESLRDLLYSAVLQQASTVMQPLWASTQGRLGWMSAQVDPAYSQRAEKMVEHGQVLARLAANVMIKVPGSHEGYQAICTLVSQGYSINNTFCYTVSQFVSCLAAIEEGLKKANASATQPGIGQYLITFMIGRFGAQQEFQLQAAERNITLSDQDKRWAELAIYQEMLRVLDASGLPVRLLLSSLKIDKGADGVPMSWHLEKTGAGPTVYTLTPEICEFLVLRKALGRPVIPDADVTVPAPVLEKLLHIPYFREAYCIGGIAPADFAHHPAFLTTCAEAMEARRRLHDFASLHASVPGRIAYRSPANHSLLSGAQA